MAEMIILLKIGRFINQNNEMLHVTNLAELYSVEIKAMNQAVKRSMDRFCLQT